MDVLARKAVVLGAGLLGGSLGMAMRARGVADSVRVWSPSPATREACSRLDWCAAVFDSPAEACAGADLVFFCGPVDTIPALMEKIAPVCGEGCLLTDVGSTKAGICEAGNRFFPGGGGATFIGSHPMAGSEKSGIAHAEAMLFEGKTCILTPMDAPPGALGRLRSLWKALGMTLLECSPREHDRIVAYVSHLPHALAAALCRSLADLPAEWRACAGAGLKDTSRVAAGDPRLWSAIFRENGEAFRESLTSLRKSLDELESALDEDSSHSLRSFLEKAQAYRIGLDSDTPKGAAEANRLLAQDSRDGLDSVTPPSSFPS